MIEKPKSIFELIDSQSFRKRPAMYLGKKSISYLKTFMDGYDFCLFTINSSEQETTPPFWTFLRYVERKTNQLYSSYNWNGLILNKNNGNEEKALDHFFELFDTFRKIEIKKIYSIELNEENKSHFRRQKYEYFTNIDGELIKHFKKPLDNITYYDLGREIGIASITEHIIYDNIDTVMNQLKEKYGPNIKLNEKKNG